MKTKEELNALKVRIESLSKELHALSEEELAQVSGGVPHFELKTIDVRLKGPIGFDNRTTCGGGMEEIYD